MILVTGASGLLGASVVSHARELGHNVVSLCHNRAFRFPSAQVHKVDLNDALASRAILMRLKPSIVIHCAAATNVDWCEDHPAEAAQINTASSAMLAMCARELGASFVHISTDAVFDGKRGNYTEADEPKPLNVYAESKLLAEREVLRQHPSALIARVNIYGWNTQNKFSLAESVLSQLAAKKPVPGFTDVQFTPILVNDLAECLLEMLDRELSGLYHVVGSEKISKFEFAQRVALMFGYDPGQVVPTRIADARLRAARAPDMSLNTDKITAALGRTMPDVESGLRRFHALYQEGYSQKLKSYLSEAEE